MAWEESQWKSCAKVGMAVVAAGPNQLVLLSSAEAEAVRTKVDSGELRKRAQAVRMAWKWWFTFELRKAARPDAVPMGQSRMALMGKPTRPEGLKAGARVRMELRRCSIMV